MKSQRFDMNRARTGFYGLMFFGSLFAAMFGIGVAFIGVLADDGLVPGLVGLAMIAGGVASQVVLRSRENRVARFLELEEDGFALVDDRDVVKVAWADVERHRWTKVPRGAGGHDGSAAEFAGSALAAGLATMAVDDWILLLDLVDQDKPLQLQCPLFSDAKAARTALRARVDKLPREVSND